METTNLNVPVQGIELANNAKSKSFQFEIMQEGFKLSFSLEGDAKTFNKSNAELTNAIVRQITGKLYSLMLIRKMSGQNLGISLSKDFYFGFTVGTRFINTTAMQEQLNLKLKVGNKADKRKKFELVLTLIIAEIMRGNNLYTAKEISKLDDELNSLTVLKQAKKLTTKKPRRIAEVTKTA